MFVCFCVADLVVVEGMQGPCPFLARTSAGVKDLGRASFLPSLCLMQGPLLLPSHVAAAAVPPVLHRGAGSLAGTLPAQQPRQQLEQQQQQSAARSPAAARGNSPLLPATGVDMFTGDVWSGAAAAAAAAAATEAVKAERSSPSPGFGPGAAGLLPSSPMSSPFLHQPRSPFLPPTPGGGPTLAAASPIPAQAVQAAGTNGAALGSGSSTRRSRQPDSQSCCNRARSTPTQPCTREHFASQAASGSPLPLHIQLAASVAAAGVPACPFAVEELPLSLPTTCLPAADVALLEQMAAATAPVALPVLPHAKPLPAAKQLQNHAASGRPGGLAAGVTGQATMAAAMPAEQGLGRHASPGSVDWAQLLLVRLAGLRQRSNDNLGKVSLLQANTVQPSGTSFQTVLAKVVSSSPPGGGVPSRLPAQQL